MVKQLPINVTTTGSKPNLPLIRHPTKTIQVSRDFVKKLLCHEKLDVTSNKPTEDSKTKEVSVGNESIFISTKPVHPTAVQNGKNQVSDHSATDAAETNSLPAVSTSSYVPKMVKNISGGADELPSGTEGVSSPDSPPFQPISMGKQSPSESSQSSSLNIPLSPYLHLCQGSSRGVSPLLSRCSSLGSIGELDRMFGTDSQVSAQCRSKSVSPVTDKAIKSEGTSPTGTLPTPIMLLNKASSTNNATTIPNTCIQTCMITTAGVTPTVATPVRLGLPVPITQVMTTPRQVTVIPGAPVPAVNQSRIGQFMPMSSVLPPHPATGHIPIPSTLCSPVNPCISPATYVPTTSHMPSPTCTAASTPAGLITPTSSAQCTSDINFYRTPTSLPLGSIQPKAFQNGQTQGIPAPCGTPYVLSGIGGSIGQLQPVQRRLTLALPPASQS